MAGILATFLSAYKTALATAGFTAAPTSMMTMDNLPVSNLHRNFRLLLSTDASAERVYGGAGSSSVQEFAAEVDLEIHWNPEKDADAVEQAIADDFNTAATVMLKQGNRTANGLAAVSTNGQGIVQVEAMPGMPLFRIMERNGQHVVARGTFSVRYRETRDLS